MKPILVLIAAGLFAGAVQAQEANPEDYEVILPTDAQECILPAAPDAIPDNASLDQLKAAKVDVKTFQDKVMVYRDCLAAAEENPDNTPGNKQAIVDSFNYSVEMEERVAARFNSAVQDYKARKAANEG